MKYKYNIKNLDCANCAKTIENKLNEDKNIKKAIVNFNSSTVTVETDLKDAFTYIKKIVSEIEPDAILSEDKIKENKFANGIYSSTTNYDYSKVLTTTVDTKVSVLSIGNIILNNNNTNYFLSTGVSKDSNLVYVMQDDYKVYTKVSTTTLKIVPTIALDKSLLTKGDGTIESPYEVE